jgi:hypothetical protein
MLSIEINKYFSYVKVRFDVTYLSIASFVELTGALTLGCAEGAPFVGAAKCARGAEGGLVEGGAELRT